MSKNTPSELKLDATAPAAFAGLKTLNLQVFVMIAAIVVIMLFFTWTTDGSYLSARNVPNLLRQTGILAVGMVFVHYLGGNRPVGRVTDGPARRRWCNNACKGIKVEQVLDAVGISRSNLEKRFKEEVGETIHTVIHSKKLENARSLLVSTSLSINEISQMCGYPSLQYFYSVFKKEYDTTPKEYRERFREALI